MLPLAFKNYDALANENLQWHIVQMKVCLTMWPNVELGLMT